MKILCFFEHFNPITNQEIETIKKYSDQYDLILLYPENSATEKKQINEMISICFSKYDNITSDFEYYDLKEKINAKDIINKLKSNYSDASVSFLLLDGDNSAIIDEIACNKIKLQINPISEISYNDYEYEARNLISLKCPISIISYIVKNNLYFMVKINKYLDGKRLIHSINVAELSYKIALSNNLDNPDLYFIAGLLHDLGKHVSNKEKISIMERFYRKFINIPSFSYHQFAGAYKAKALFPNLNDSVYKAILTHATGDSSMNLMQRIVYASDKIEPSRGYDSTEMINLCLKNIEEGFIRVLKENIKFLIASDCDIKNVLTDRCVNYYLN